MIDDKSTYGDIIHASNIDHVINNNLVTEDLVCHGDLVQSKELQVMYDVRSKMYSRAENNTKILVVGR